MEKADKRRVLGIAFLLILVGILVVRCWFSFCQTDESYYAALVHRFWIGEKPVLDEWSSGQFYIPLLLPFYSAYMLIHGSSEGAILFLRLLYIGFSAITAAKLYCVVRRETEDDALAVVSAAIVLLFSRGNIYGVSYYNMCMVCGISGFCSIASAQEKPSGKAYLNLCWAGILFACSVLCNPFLTPVFIILALGTMLRKRKAREALIVTVGIAGMALVYCLYLVIETGLQNVFAWLPYVLSNPEQSSVTGNLIHVARQAARLSKYNAIPALLMTVACAFYKRKIPDRWFLLYTVLQTALLAVFAWKTVSEINGIVLFALTVIAFPCWITAWRTKQSILARQFYLLGLLNAVAYAAASNTGIDAGTVGFCMSGAAGIWLIRDTILQSRQEQRTETVHTKSDRGAEVKQRVILVALSMVVIIPMFCQRVVGVYRDAPLTELNTRLSQGPGKGLYTTRAHAEQYESICNALNGLTADYPQGRILFCKNLPWAYLATEYGYATSSPWRTYTDDLKTYYTIRPENRADYICILSETAGGWEKSPFHSNPARSNPNAFDYQDEFWEQIISAPVLAETDLLRVFDVRELLKGDM